MVTPSLVALIVSAAVMMASACFSAAQDLDTLKARHVLLIVLENEDFSKVVEDPYFDKLRTRGKWFSNSQAITHPSYPNYLALVAGDTFGVKNDHLKDFHDPDPKKYATIADLLEAKHLTWKSYAQGYPPFSSVSRSVRRWASRMASSSYAEHNGAPVNENISTAMRSSARPGKGWTDGR